MDSLITAAARALATGDLLGVLKRVGLRTQQVSNLVIGDPRNDENLIVA